MKMSHACHQTANFNVRRQEQIRRSALGIRASKFTRDLNALVRALVHTELLARRPQALGDPARLSPCLDRMRRLASDAVWLVHELSESGVCCPPATNPVRRDNSRSIPVSRWKVVAFKKDVRRFKSQSGNRSAPQASPLQMNPRATLISRC